MPSPPSEKPRCPRRSPLQRLSTRITRWTGTSTAFVLAFGSVVVWGLTGPVFHFSDTWQLVMNTATSIITFLMVFIIQRSQNKDSLAIQLKLNEIVSAITGADNGLIDIEDLSEEQLQQLHQRYQRLAAKIGEAVALPRAASDRRAAEAIAEQRDRPGADSSRG